MYSCLFILAIFSSLINVCHLYRILLQPCQSTSHVIYFIGAVEKLQGNGHEIYLILGDKMHLPSSLVGDFNITVLNYKTPYDLSPVLRKSFSHQLIEETVIAGGSRAFVFYERWSVMAMEECSYMMADKKLVETVQSLDIDLAIVDSWPIMACGYILPASLGIPYISLSSVMEWWATRTPSLPSFVPAITESYQSDMSFKQRIYNTILNILFSIFPLFNELNNLTLIERYMPDSNKQWHHFKQDSLLFLNNQDFLLGDAVPLMPNVINVGGLTLRSIKPLPDFINNQIENIDDVIVVSFGSLTTYLPDDMNTKLYNMLRNLTSDSIAVFWRFNGAPLNSTLKNIHTYKWLPQNDLLSHNKTRLFISHCGNNGQFEALYHAVPILCLPIFGDQNSNGERIAKRKYGMTANILTESAESLTTKAYEVMNNPKYKKSISRSSKIFRSKPQSGKDAATYWIEYVIQYGDLHLRSSVHSMSLYEFLLLDVLSILLIVCFVTLVIVYHGLAFVAKRLKGIQMMLKSKLD